MNVRMPALFNSFIFLWIAAVEIVSIACAEPTVLSGDDIPPVATVNPIIEDSEDFFNSWNDDDDDDDDDVILVGSSTVNPSTFWRTESSDEAEGEFCRMQLLNKWLDAYVNAFPHTAPPQDANNLDIFSLKAIQETTLYKTIVEDCSFFLNEFNIAAGSTCLRQEEYEDTSYSDFWKIGPINMDGGWLLAAELLLSNQLEDSNPLVPCSDSCYIRYPWGGGDDCQRSEADIVGSPYFDVTKITLISTRDEFTKEIELRWRNQRVLCELGWYNTDRAYQNLRMCASESKVARTMISENNQANSREGATNGVSERTKKASLVANAFASQRQKQAECAEYTIEFACPRFDEAASYDGYDDDYFYHSFADDDYYGDEASNAPFAATQGIVVAATVALVILFMIP